MTDFTDLASRAKFARQRAGYMTQQDAALAIGCSRAAVAMWESGGSSVISRYLFKSAVAFKVHPVWLSTGEGDDCFPWSPEGAPGDTSDVVNLKLALIELYQIVGRQELELERYRKREADWLEQRAAARKIKETPA